MKSYTDIEESRKLAKILPIESADTWYANGIIVARDSVVEPDDIKSVIPCWSLAALLGALPVSCDDGQHCLALINPNPNDKTEWLCSYEDCKGDLMMECYADNPIDACYEMILKLHKLKML